MIPLSQPQLKRMTAIHGWSAIVLGLLLYAVVTTGAVAVFAPEIGRWSAGSARQHPALEGEIDPLIRDLAARVDPEFREDIGMWSGEGEDLVVTFTTHRINPDTNELADFGSVFRVASGTGEILSRQDGFIWEDPAGWEESALRRFLIDLHVQLYLPNPWGLILTGVLGLMMMAAVVTGFLMHKHLIRDLFVAERPGRRLVSARDRHVLASSWSLPFAFVLAFTGSFFSFASSVGFPMLAQVAFNGDAEAMSHALFEAPVPEDARPVPTASLDAILSDSSARTEDAPADFVSIHHFGRADARVTVWHAPDNGEMLWTANEYDGPRRMFLGEKPTVGSGPSLGGTLYGWMRPLHFGDFAGFFSQVIWGALGVAMCFVILSGIRLWLRKKPPTPLWRGFGRATQIVGYGLPVGMLASAYVFFLARPAGDPFFWTPLGFCLGAAVAIVIGLVIEDIDRLGQSFQRLLAGLCLLLPVARLATGGLTWAEALMRGQLDVLSVDLSLLVAGGALWYFARRGAATLAPTRLEPAE
jgi:uncharacterized iron-regulated membrane protein